MLLSVLVWGAVTIDANPTAEVVLQENVPVDPVGIPDNMVLMGSLQPVQLAVRGPKTSLDLLTARSFVARLRLSSLGEGIHLLPVEVEVADPSVEILRITPSELAVRLEQNITQETPVRLLVSGEPDQGFRAQANEITYAPDRIFVEGAAEAVRRVAFLEVRVSLTGATSNLSIQVAARPVDSAGEEVAGVSPGPNLVDVFVPIERITARKTVPVRLQVVGVPAQGRVASRYFSTPSSIEIEGEPDVIDAVEQILAEPIDIAGAIEDVEADVALIVPPEIVLVRGAGDISARIEIGSIQNSTVFLTGVIARNVPEQMVATINPTSIQVLLTGAADSLAELGPTDIRAEIDLANRAPGIHQVQPTVFIPPGIEVAAVVPSTISVGLSLLPTPTPTPTATSTPTATPSPTPEPEVAEEPTPGATDTPTPVPTPTNSPTPTASPTPTPPAPAG